MLAILGLSQVEQKLYEMLVARPAVTAAELAEIAGEQDRAGDGTVALGRLQALGLVTEIPADPPRYVVLPPDPALETLLAARGSELARARQAMITLTTRFHRARSTAPTGADDTGVAVVRDLPALARELATLTGGVRQEIRMVDAPPYLDDPHTGAVIVGNPTRHGVSVRILYDRAGIDIPGRLPVISACIDAGVRARVGATPMKLVLVDDTAAVLPLERAVPNNGGVVVRDRRLVRFLAALFEAYWERAVPLRIRDGRAEMGQTVELSDVDRDVLYLLVSGLTDQAIAAHLGLTDRTVRRRVRDLMTRLDARTRFQAGYQAVVRGWLSAPALAPAPQRALRAQRAPGPRPAARAVTGD